MNKFKEKDLKHFMSKQLQNEAYKTVISQWQLGSELVAAILTSCRKMVPGL